MLDGGVATTNARLSVGGVLFSWRPDAILWVPGLLHFSLWAWLKCGPPEISNQAGAVMENQHRGRDVSNTIKRRFMHTAWLGNGLAFVMAAGFSALTPQMGERLGLTPAFAIWLACTLNFSRSMAFILFWKWEGWHYRMDWSQAALWIAPASLAIAFFANHPTLIFGALIVFGMAVGLSYSGSIYYSMDYGENKGEQGGLHESIIGMGVFIGPLLAGMASASVEPELSALAAQWTILILTIVSSLVGFGLIQRSIRQEPCR